MLLRTQEPKAPRTNPGFLRAQEHGIALNKSGCVYLMASQRNGTIYLGVTVNLPTRAYQHRNGLIYGFTREHGCTLLVWYEAHDDLQEARRRELQMKKWKRAWKLDLIERSNPQWKDLYDTLFQCSCERRGPGFRRCRSYPRLLRPQEHGGVNNG